MADVLFIDTCGSQGSIAVLSTEPATILAERTIPGRETQERLLQAVSEVLAETVIDRTALHALAAITGPGSFTGVRIGLAAIKGFAESLALPVIAISRLCWMAETAFAENVTAIRVSAWLDAGRTEIYAGDYVRTSSGIHCRGEALWTRASLRNRADDDTSASSQNIADNSVEVVVTLEPALAEQLPGTVLLTDEALRTQLVHMVADAMRTQNFANPVLLDANYLRVPDAELALRARQAAQSS